MLYRQPSQEMYNQVRHMNIVFGKPACASMSAVEKQMDCLPEEYSELVHAVSTWNIKEIRDALCDILVFSLGAFHLLNVGEVAFTLAEGRELPTTPEGTGVRVYQIAKEFGQLCGLTIPSKEGKECYLIRVVERALYSYYLIGYNPEVDMNAVYASNMSKLCATQEDAEASLEKYRKMGVDVYQAGEAPTISIRSAVDQRVDGVDYPKDKFLKGIRYQKPVFA